MKSKKYTQSWPVRLALALTLTLAFITNKALAEQYSVDVTVSASLDEVPVVVTQTQAMTFPTISVLSDTLEGADCHSIDISHPNGNSKGFDGTAATTRNSLCPNRSGTPASFEITGTPNALIRISIVMPVQTQSGVRFSGTGYEYDTVVPSSGMYKTNLSGTVALVDKSLATTAALSFTYDFSAIYQ
ncbi:hypothetical protein KIH87_05770 [Paraneptunicella aestuarii]|uniref:hypothetical protein n=1 Tax=Paraneptunicella aestuarii TaxID=2831148 RepID=UPI001E5FD4A6|nr:hypothetical protein [Paraneptunicella aestuarii]UAA39861.1 hypothetical protein KIH87_05770 [Paraneptunicella aestuarii]